MISLASILTLPSVHIETEKGRSKMESGVIKMLRRVRPDWPRDDIILERFSEGFSNVIYGGYTSDRAQMILVKIYGSQADRSRELLAMRVFAARGFGSRLFATFGNGHVYEFAVGVPLKYEHCIDGNVYPTVATTVGQLHRQMLADAKVFSGSTAVSGAPESHVFATLRRWLKQVPNEKELPSKLALERELNELESVILKKHPPTHSSNLVVFCHGDLNPANIVFDPVGGRVSLIDLEFCGENFAAFEIAQHFLTFVGGDLGRVGREEFVPAREFQIRWCQYYIAGFKGVPIQRVQPWEVEDLFASVQKFSLVFCLQEIIWSLVRVDKTTLPGLDILQYGIQRFQQYHRNKYRILSQQ